MLVSYHDVKSRISEEPTWYTADGYPRYGEFESGSCNIYAKYSVLMQIQCQDCGKPFFIGDDYDDSDLIAVEIDLAPYNANAIYKIEPKESPFFVPLRRASYAPRVLVDGKHHYKHLTPQEIVEGWRYGDPPSHGCVGDTMGCVEIGCVQFWDIHFGQVVENGCITVWGEPARLPEIEKIKFDIPNWYKFPIHGIAEPILDIIE